MKWIFNALTKYWKLIDLKKPLGGRLAWLQIVGGALDACIQALCLQFAQTAERGRSRLSAGESRRPVLKAYQLPGFGQKLKFFIPLSISACLHFTVFYFLTHHSYPTTKTTLTSPIQTQRMNLSQLIDKNSPKNFYTKTEIEKISNHAFQKNQKPPYPPMALRLRQEGSAILKVYILKDGRIDDIHFEKRTGHALLDQSLEKTIQTWNIPNPKQIEYWAQLPKFRFEIEDRD